MKKTINLVKKSSRVDYQVSIIMIGILILSFLCVYLFNYYFTYKDMLYTLEERSNSIYEYIDKQLDKTTFYDINAKEDVNKESYTKMKQDLHTVKSSSGVRYLYTAKKTDTGEYIYIVDGLADDSADFRYPGDKIEDEIVSELNLALEDQVILPSSIKQTDWGNIFISYYPIHDKGKVVGAIGIEFDADHQFQTFKLIRYGTPIIGISFCVLAIGIAVVLFRRISNPTYQDFANTDSLTGLKNRNSFDVRVHNIQNKARDGGTIGIVVADLNNLKQINDFYGHQYGDEYIKRVSEVFIESTKKHFDTEIYRVGGDEFVLLVPNVAKEGILAIIKNIRVTSEETYISDFAAMSVALGMAIFDTKSDTSFLIKYNQADHAMYKDKKRSKKE